MSNGKHTIICLIVGSIKKANYKWVNIFRNQNSKEGKWKFMLMLKFK